MKVRLILVFPPPTHPETKVWDVGPLLRLGRGGGKAEYRAGWPEAKVILNISRVRFFFRTERISCKPQRTKEIWSENWRRKLLHCSLEKTWQQHPCTSECTLLHLQQPPFPKFCWFGKTSAVEPFDVHLHMLPASPVSRSNAAFVRSLAILNQQMHKILNVS